MTKDHANAIMFAYRYDNLTISESLFKQLIGDIAIMRTPWPIFSIAALSGAACLISDHFFSYETMWIAVVVFLVLLALCFFAYCKYEPVSYKPLGIAHCQKFARSCEDSEHPAE